MTEPSPPTILFDDQCALCQRAVDVATRRRLNVDFVGLSDADLVSRGVDEERTRHEIAFVHSNGDVVYGYRAVAAALQQGGDFTRAIGRALTWPLVGPVADRVYRFVAQHRRRSPTAPKNH